MKYNVMVFATASVYAEVEVTADSDTEAIELAYYEAGDWEIDDIDDITNARIISCEEDDEDE
jgi:hypothetical protein